MAKAEIKYLHLQYVPTKNVFKIPEAEAKEILKSDRGNYKIIDKDFVDEVEEVQETTVSQQVIAEEETETQETETEGENEGETQETKLEDLTKDELKKLCTEKGIEFKNSDKKDELIAKLNGEGETQETN